MISHDTPQILALADDLTGALETGAQLAAEGIRCIVAADGHGEGSADALVLNLETRHASEADAERIVRAAVASNRPRHIYLKTDSTLRGRIVESLRALIAEFPEREIVYVPAYPALGRTVRKGVLFVDGVPLAETPFARDPLNPVRDSSIAALVGDLAIVHDGESDGDLAAVAASLDQRPRIVAGTAAFVRHWARTLPVTRAASSLPIPKASGGLIVVGSRHPVSRAQAANALQTGLQGWTLHLLPDALCGDPLDVARQCGEQVRTMFEQQPAGALVVFGGDTAAAILKALGCRIAWPYGELLPGVPVSRIEAQGRTLTLITKAGGFGDERTLLRIIEGIR